MGDVTGYAVKFSGKWDDMWLRSRTAPCADADRKDRLRFLTKEEAVSQAKRLAAENSGFRYVVVTIRRRTPAPTGMELLDRAITALREEEKKDFDRFNSWHTDEAHGMWLSTREAVNIVERVRKEASDGAVR